MLRDTAYTYGWLGDEVRFPGLSESELAFVRDQAEYYFALEAKEISKCATRWEGTVYYRYCGV